MTGALIVAVAAVGFGVVTMLVAYALVTAALNREVHAVRAGQYAREIGYRRYMASSVTIVRYAVSIALLVPVVCAIFSPVAGELVRGNNSEALTQLFGGVPMDRLVDVTFGYAICVFGALFTIPLGAYDLLTVPLGIRALAELRGIALGGREAFFFRLRHVLVRLAPSLVLLETTGAVAFVNIVAALVVLIAGLLVLVALRRAFAAPLMLWMTPSVPIERTQWAALGPRIRAWGQLTGVRVKAIYVQQTERLGMGPIAAVGPRRARVLFTGDALLRNTDWRQQDALMVYVLTTDPASAARRRQRIPRLVSLGVLLLALGMIGALTLTARSNVELPLAATVVLLIASLLVLLGFLALLGFLIFNLIFGRRQARKPFFEGDARVAAITGGPLALMVALNTLHALSGVPTDRRIGLYPSIAERVAALDALLRQPGPRAPYTWQLVPSIVPVFVGPYCLTVPLASAPQSAPAPVHAGPYPVVMPPVAAPTPVPISASPPVPFAPPIPPTNPL